MRITFFDVTDNLHSTLQVTSTIRSDPHVAFVANGAVLNYSQVFKLRDKLNDWLGKNIGTGQPLWKDEE